MNATTTFEAVSRTPPTLDESIDVHAVRHPNRVLRPVQALTERRTATTPDPTSAGNKTAVDSQEMGVTNVGLSVVERCRAFVASKFGGNLLYTSSGFVAYQSGYWSGVDVATVMKPALLQFLGDEAEVRDIEQMMAMLRISKASRINPYDTISHLICLQNGTLDPLSCTLRPNSPTDYLSNRREIAWDPEAACPRWVQALEEFFAPDGDRQAKIDLLQEFIGYCLIPDTSMHKFLWLVGGGANGKSVVLKVLTEVVGSANVNHAELSRLGSKFARAELQGKLLNISAEMPTTINDSYLKQIVAGDVTEAERKYQASFSFKPTARLVGATNALPRLRDYSEGFRRRAIILTFNRQFAESEQDRELAEKLLEELPGILVWAAAGLRRLKERGSFVLPPSSVAALDDYRRDSNPVRQFEEELLEDVDNVASGLAASAMYKAYEQWRTARGHERLSESLFKQRLAMLGHEQRRGRAGRFWMLRMRQSGGSVEAEAAG